MQHLKLGKPAQRRFSAHFGGISSRLFTYFFVIALFLGGCGSSDNQADDDAQCSEDDQCPDGQSCLLGTCIARDGSRCFTQADCPSNDYQCVDSQCRHTGFDAGDEGAAGDATGSAPDAGITQPGPDGQAPRVLSTTPADGATNVDPEIELTVTFDQDMEPVSMNHFSLALRNVDGRSLPLYADYDEASRTATIHLEEALKPGEAYRMDIDKNARNLEGVGVDPAETIRFSTTYEEPAHHRELAETWAPVIYQGVSLRQPADEEDGERPAELMPAVDIPTRLNFDDNLRARDNLENARQLGAEIPASVYYQVSESTQYYFLHYLLYYPARYLAEDDSFAEHDFAGLALVINKADGKLRLAETVSQRDSGQSALGFRPESSPARAYEGDLGQLALLSFGDDALEDGTRFPLYMRAGVHEACNWQRPGDRGQCLHPAAQFQGAPEQGVVMRAGDPQTFSEASEGAASGLREMTYELASFTAEFWFLRDRFGDDELFELAYPYRPQGRDRPGDLPPEERRMLPRKLLSDVDSTYGRTPFGWLPSSGQNNEGQWLLDPVYILPNRYRFAETVHTEYCHNIFFGIDQLSAGSPDGCAP